MALISVSEWTDGSLASSYTKDVSKGTKLTFTRSGYDFGNFNIAASGGWKYTTSSNTLTFTAVDSSAMCVVNVNFMSGSYSVTFNPNGGSVSP